LEVGIVLLIFVGIARKSGHPIPLVLHTAVFIRSWPCPRVFSCNLILRSRYRFTFHSQFLPPAAVWFGRLFAVCLPTNHIRPNPVQFAVRSSPFRSPHPSVWSPSLVPHWSLQDFCGLCRIWSSSWDRSIFFRFFLRWCTVIPLFCAVPTDLAIGLFQ